ncbi:MFS transporter [Fodinicola acaciae]|uniref:MFS transporter n=1 Tax=Fodinicola acaciae TaxID=2681555 RepID=UPI0013D010B0|nr:MFS transporter [Fodinicola acaciae]
MGRRFGWLWAAYAVSTYGSGLSLGAFSLIAVTVLHAGPVEVALLPAAGLAVGAVVAVPLGPWVEFRRKRPVMIAMDLARFAALVSVPVGYALGMLSIGQLMVVAVVVAGAKIAFNAASGAYLKTLVRPEKLLVANARFESTMWTATVVGPPLGGAAIGVFGPVTTMLADAVSYLLSAAGISAIGGTEPRPARTGAARARELVEGWRHTLAHPVLRPLFLNSVVVNALIMATEPLMAILLLRQLGFPPWQYGLAFAAPCVGGLVGARLARPLVARFGQRRVMLASGVLRVCWPIGLAFVGPGVGGIALVIGLQFGLVTCIGVFNPVVATYRLEQTDKSLIARTLAAWSVTSNATIAAMTALWGVVASFTGVRTAVGLAGLLLLVTPLLLVRAAVRARRSHPPRGRRARARPPAALPGRQDAS